jgi:hypothetical protein
LKLGLSNRERARELFDYDSLSVRLARVLDSVPFRMT